MVHHERYRAVYHKFRCNVSQKLRISHSEYQSEYLKFSSLSIGSNGKPLLCLKKVFTQISVDFSMRYPVGSI